MASKKQVPQQEDLDKLRSSIMQLVRLHKGNDIMSDWRLVGVAYLVLRHANSIVGEKENEESVETALAEAWQVYTECGGEYAYKSGDPSARVALTLYNLAEESIINTMTKPEFIKSALDRIQKEIDLIKSTNKSLLID